MLKRMPAVKSTHKTPRNYEIKDSVRRQMEAAERGGLKGSRRFETADDAMSYLMRKCAK